MNVKNKNSSVIRVALLSCIIVLFLFIGVVFIYQYGQYRTLENRLTEAFRLKQADSESLNQLFSTFGEVEHTFRLYTLDFSDSSYHDYKQRLGLLKHLVDSVTNLPEATEPVIPTGLDIEGHQRIALEFAALKERLDRLVQHTSDSLKSVPPAIDASMEPSTFTSVVDGVFQDTSSKPVIDTIVRKRPGLLKRIFDAKDDTIVIANHSKVGISHVTLLKENLSTAQSELERSHRGEINGLRSTFRRLQTKERQLITTNLDLLENLKETVAIIKALDTQALKRAETDNLALYKKNVGVFGRQLMFALTLMLVMVGALVYYQIYATSYEQRLRVEKDYAARLAEEKTSVLANISHEIRTPLNSLLGIVDLLKNRAKLDNADEKLIDSAYYSVNIINNNIVDILNLSKLEDATKEDIAMAYFSPYRSLHELVALHRNQAELKKLRLRAEIDIDPASGILSNEFRIKQIASNFLSNAIKYTQKGEITFRASIATTEGTQALYLEVEDSGIGVPEHDRRQVFRKYYTASPNAGGIGLGLYISKIMVRELGGSIGVKGKTGNGSIFFATIPFSESRLDAHEQRKATLADLPAGLRLLVVDDNPINILFMKQFFKDMENVHMVNNGEEAIAFLAEHPIEVVMTDINMPGISGLQLLEAIRSSERLQPIKVLAISADKGTLPYADKNHRQASFDGFIEKPLTESEVVSAILHALNDR